MSVKWEVAVLFLYGEKHDHPLGGGFGRYIKKPTTTALCAYLCQRPAPAGGTDFKHFLHLAEKLELASRS